MATITSDNGRHYEFVANCGGGGFGKVSKVKCLEDGKIYAFKFFPPPKDNDLATQNAQRNIRKNVSSLVKKPIIYSNGATIDSLVQPLEMVSKVPSAKDPNKTGFGYIMDFKTVDDFGTVFKSWKRTEQFRPDAKQMCEICIKIARVFDRIHASGRGYKDVNESNIYFDLAGDQVLIIDCDNVAADNNDTVFGTIYYVAPEVFQTEKPNAISDRYSMAVYFYRLMVGGYPLEGRKSIRYILDNGLDDSNPEDVKKIYAHVTLFAFDEKDKSNSIEKVTDSKIPANHKHQWDIQASYWHALPSSIKSMFQKVFSENLTGTAIDRRPTENQWIRLFENILKNEIVKCKCGKHNYAENENCAFCGKKLPPPPPKEVEAPKNAVKYKVLSGKTSGKEAFTLKLKGADVLPSVFGDKQVILQTESYSRARKMMKIINTSGCTINIKYPNGVQAYVVNGGSAYVMEKSEIDFMVNGKSAAKLRIEAFSI